MTRGLMMSHGNGLRLPEQHDALRLPHHASLTRMPQTMSKSRKQQLQHEMSRENEGF